VTGPAEPSEEGAATRKLAQLHEQTMRVRAELARLRRDLGQVQRDFDGARAAHAGDGARAARTNANAG